MMSETFPGVKVVSGPAVPSTRLPTAYVVRELVPSDSYGKPTAGAWNPLAPSEDIKPGDVLRITYQLRIPFLEQWQSNFLVARLAKDGRYALRHYALNEELSRLVVEVEIIKSGTPALAIGLAIAAVVAGGLIFISVHSIEKLGQLEIGPLKANLAPVIALGILAVVGLALWRRL